MVQVQAAVQVTQQLIDSQSPGVAALMLHRLQQQAGKCWGQTTGDQQAQGGDRMHMVVQPAPPICMISVCGLLVVMASVARYICCQERSR